MKRITNISEAFNPEEITQGIFNKKAPTPPPPPEDMLQLSKPEFKDELREVQALFSKHNRDINVGIVAPNTWSKVSDTGKITPTPGKLHVKVTRNRTEEIFTIYVDTTYVVFKIEISKRGYNLFKAKDIIFGYPFMNTIHMIKNAILDVLSYTEWDLYDGVLDQTIMKDLKLAPEIKISR